MKRLSTGTVGTLVLLCIWASTASAATSLIAAYDQYVPGQGFEIRLVDTGTGLSIPLPDGVNTSDDEIHPALTPGGRYLVFTRMHLAPQLNGDVVPPPTCTSNSASQITDGTSNTVMVGENDPCTESLHAIGIVVARVVGTHRVLGRKLPKLRPLGRVPLGRSRKGQNRYHWNGRVNGHALGRGTYVITFRGLTRTGRVQATSRSIEFRVTRQQRITGVRVLR